ncbi:11447_t:CDS:2 [Dentiscutata heterogama]|uniref:11447_t:CDS:1 n=1 Tax=Dentiscutata heterogama TaxID=1316150 RepID=A0ACA9KR25_9GLOM|nr:11447_t:CDS:2 [Dentiscutata heterogama]
MVSSPINNNESHHPLTAIDIIERSTYTDGSWSHLRNILAGTDNNNPLPSNRPLHTTLHFIHRLQNLKKHV